MSRLWDPNAPEAAASLGSLEGAVERRLATMASDRIVERIHERDHTVWRPDPREISDRLGWLTLPLDMNQRVPELKTFARRAADDGFTHALLLGMGGSSLAPETMRKTLGAELIDLAVLDTTHPAHLLRVARSLDLAKTMFIVASKSGGTIETLSHMEYFWAKQPRGSQFVAITNPGTTLEQTARARDFREIFLNPPDIGGRYSALSLFGLVPAALMGVDLAGLLDHAHRAAGACASREENPGAYLGAVLGEAALHGRDKATLAFPKELEAFGPWAEQLIAESTGKDGKGILPVAGEPLAEPKVYGDDRLFIASGAVHDRHHLEHLSDAGQPVLRVEADAASLGTGFYIWEFATAVAGYVLGIHPFDQPNVAEAKEATASILKAGTKSQDAFDDLRALLGHVHEGDYIAIQAFLEPSPENERVLQDARVALRDRYGVATTVGFGPRYLHSTGQLHKGGPSNGLFIQVVDAERDEDAEIPGAPYTFGALIDAQAEGDLRSLRALGRRVARVTAYHLEEVH